MSISLYSFAYMIAGFSDLRWLISIARDRNRLNPSLTSQSVDLLNAITADRLILYARNTFRVKGKEPSTSINTDQLPS